MATPIEIQKKYDTWLTGVPAIQKYVIKLYYLEANKELPTDVTHTIRVNSVTSGSRNLHIGVVAKPELAKTIDELLALTITQP